MAEERTPARRDGPGDPPSEVHIEIVRPPRGRGPTRHRQLQHAGALAVLATTILAVAAVTLILVSRQHHASSAPPARGSHSVSSAYGYPARCLAVTVDPSDRAYARADFDRRRECGRWHGYTTAIFHRLDGRWREVLDTSSYSCPVSSLPKVVQEQLAVCPIAQTK